MDLLLILLLLYVLFKGTVMLLTLSLMIVMGLLILPFLLWKNRKVPFEMWQQYKRLHEYKRFINCRPRTYWDSFLNPKIGKRGRM